MLESTVAQMEGNMKAVVLCIVVASLLHHRATASDLVIKIPDLEHEIVVS